MGFVNAAILQRQWTTTPSCSASQISTFIQYERHSKKQKGIKNVIAALSSVRSSNNGGKRHVIITGGNCGIGKATAMELARQGMFITLACRNKEKGDNACSEITRLTGNPDVRAMECDLASLESVRKFVQGYNEEGFPLHVLVNNAGIMACPQSYTQDGFEMQFGVNHLGHFLLTASLLEALVASSSPGSNSRVVVLASAAERIGSIDFNDINYKYSRAYNPWLAYGQSKLANCLFSYELSRRCKVANINVTSNSMHPGIVDTELIRYVLPQMMVKSSIFPELRSFILKILGLKTPEEGASTAVHLASSKSVECVSGLYFEDCQVRSPSSQAQNANLAAKLWKVSEELTGTSDLFAKLSLNV